MKQVKVTFQITRNLSDHLKPRYMAKLGKRVITDGRTINEVRNQVASGLGSYIDPVFIVMAE